MGVIRNVQDPRRIVAWVAHAKRNGFNDIALFFNDAQQLKSVMPALGTIDGVRYRVVLADWIKGGRGANCTHFEWAQAWVLQHCLYQAKAEGIPYVLYQDTDEFLVKTSGENPLPLLPLVLRAWQNQNGDEHPLHHASFGSVPISPNGTVNESPECNTYEKEMKAQGTTWAMAFSKTCPTWKGRRKVIVRADQTCYVNTHEAGGDPCMESSSAVHFSTDNFTMLHMRGSPSLEGDPTSALRHATSVWQARNRTGLHGRQELAGALTAADVHQGMNVTNSNISNIYASLDLREYGTFNLQEERVTLQVRGRKVRFALGEGRYAILEHGDDAEGNSDPVCDGDDIVIWQVDDSEGYAHRGGCTSNGTVRIYHCCARWFLGVSRRAWGRRNHL